MYKCSNCNKVFDEPNIIKTTYEAYYDVDRSTTTPMTIAVCPYCGSEEIEDIGETKTLKELIYEAGYTSQQEFADDIGVSRISVSKWVNGKVKPKYNNLTKICRVLSCTIEQIDL